MTTPNADKGWISTNTATEATRVDGLRILPWAEDADDPLHFQAWMTVPEAKISVCGHPGGGVRLEATTLRAAYMEVDARWPLRDEIVRMLHAVDDAQYEQECVLHKLHEVLADQAVVLRQYEKARADVLAAKDALRVAMTRELWGQK